MPRKKHASANHESFCDGIRDNAQFALTLYSLSVCSIARGVSPVTHNDVTDRVREASQLRRKKHLFCTEWCVRYMVNPNLCSGRLPRRKYFFHAMITLIWIKNRNKITVKNTCSSSSVKGFDKKQCLHRLYCLNCCTFRCTKKTESDHVSYKLKEGDIY